MGVAAKFESSKSGHGPSARDRRIADMQRQHRRRAWRVTAAVLALHVAAVLALHVAAVLELQVAGAAQREARGAWGSGPGGRPGLRLVLRLRGGQLDGLAGLDSELELAQDLDSSLGLESNSELEAVDWDAPGVQAVRFTPAARAYIDEKMREFMEYEEPKTAQDEGVDLCDAPDEDFQRRAAERFDDVLRSRPDRSSKVRGRGGYNVTGPCAGVDGSVWDYLEAAGDDIDSGNSSEFEEYLNGAREAFNRSDTLAPSFNPQDEFDDDVVRDPAVDWTYQHMFPADDWEARYNVWRTIQMRARRERVSERRKREQGGADNSSRSPRTASPAPETAGQHVPADPAAAPGACADSPTATQDGPRPAATRGAPPRPQHAHDEHGVDLSEGALGLEDGEEENEDDEEEEDEKELGESDDRPLNPPVADARMQRNFGRPFQFAGPC